MSRYVSKALLGALIVGLFVGSWVLMPTKSATAAGDDTESLVGKPAPDINLKTIDDKAFKLSDEKGSVVVLDFWATWCPPCRKSLPHLSKVSNDENLAKQGLKVYGVNARETKDQASAYLKKNNLSFTVPLDGAGSTMEAYMVHGIPTTVIVGRDGVIKNVFIGFGGEESEKAMDAAIAAALAEKK